MSEDAFMTKRNGGEKSLVDRNQAKSEEGNCRESLRPIEREPSKQMLSTYPILADVLGLKLDELPLETKKPVSDWVSFILEEFRNAIRHDDFAAVKALIVEHLNNPAFQSPKLRQFLLWHQAILVYYVDHNQQKAMQLLNSALNATEYATKSTPSAQELGILISVALLHSEEGDNGQAIGLFKQALKKATCSKTVHPNLALYLRIYDHLVQLLYESNDFHQAIEYAEKGLKLTGEDDYLPIKGELHYMRGQSFHRLGQQEEALLDLHKSFSLFQTVGLKSKAEVVQKQLALLQEGKELPFHC
ncbi:hypothetical protein CHH78_06250 [Shouchella clausii]|jgi:tetratricopeptide (TPR) repeat protein|uniref:tetratricopeptide repeat protein n=1 Tax=Shouchella clausii TaxID=79880 RepID=UPI000BA7C31C|nr:tetratricopeptide repeat protein [Shouchella clausii]MBU8596100.1 tetratricopeptide repeat protein [Shouchella clausii]PAD09806.1 hypothetical protein CHH76_07745 [Shouchella clausii]PAE84682.1 hypothetical protein CHH78_06250 [Shouchella clausii]PAF06004.1 hypothetical protein CHH66_06965 [Shouchella clausii]